MSCNKLIVIETGNIRIKVDSKLFPNSKKIGVPNKSKPTPNKDWKITNENNIEISKNNSITLH